MARGSRAGGQWPKGMKGSVLSEFLQFRSPRSALLGYAKRPISPGYEFSFAGSKVPGDNVAERKSLITEVVRALGSGATPDFRAAEGVLAEWAAKHIGQAKAWREWEADERPLVAVAAEGMVYVRRLLRLYQDPVAVLAEDVTYFESLDDHQAPPSLMGALEHYGVLALASPGFRAEFEKLGPAEMNEAISIVHGRDDVGVVGRPRKDEQMGAMERAYYGAPRGARRKVLVRMAKACGREPDSLLRSIRAFKAKRVRKRET